MIDAVTKPKTKVKTKTERPRLHKVILINDDYTPREFVHVHGIGDVDCEDQLDVDCVRGFLFRLMLLGLVGRTGRSNDSDAACDKRARNQHSPDRRQ